MSKLLATLVGLVVLAFLTLSIPTCADEITYTVQGTYDSGTLTTPASFTLTFTIPDFSGSAVFETMATDKEAGFSISAPAEVAFFSTPVGGLFDLALNTTLSSIDPSTRQITCLKPCELSAEGVWVLFGPQIFTENSTGTQFTFLPGTFPITPGAFPNGSVFFVPDSPLYASIAGGTVTGVVKSPEPTSLLLLGIGLVGWTALARKPREA